MLLSVSFLEFALTAGFGSLEWTDLVIPGAIIALALALRWMSAASDEEKEERILERAVPPDGSGGEQED
jgi:hypothetical protein